MEATTQPTPSIGRIVHYRLQESELPVIRGYGGNPVNAGDVFPAIIVKVWGDKPESAVQLKVMLDGPRDFWRTSAACDPQGKANGAWFWPPRV